MALGGQRTGGVPTATQDPQGIGAGGAGVQTLTVTAATGLQKTGTAANPVLAGVAATSLVMGMESAADKAKIDAIASPGWFDGQVQLMQIDVPELTAFEYVKPLIFPGGATVAAGIPTLGTNWTDANLDGGALLTGGGAGWGLLTGAIVNALVSSSSFSLAWSGKFPLPAAGKIGLVGVVNAGRTKSLVFDTQFAVDTTHFIASAGTGTVDIVTPVLADTSEHNFMITVRHGVGIKWRIDGVLVASSNNFTGLTDEPYFLGGFASAAVNCEIARACYGYVARS